MSNNNNNNNNQNITFFLDEQEEISNDYDTEFNINDVLQEIASNELLNDDLNLQHELKLPQLINYHENFTIKDLMLICEYYGFSKELKTQKYNKEEIIHFLVEYELNPLNSDIVYRRQNMWFYMNELKNDKFMKKYILWS
jgi:hypothetical protein